MYYVKNLFLSTFHQATKINKNFNLLQICNKNVM